MSNKDFVFSFLREISKKFATELQSELENKTPTEIVEKEDFLPDFNNKKQYLDFKTGYVCKTSSGNVVKLIQPYDSFTFDKEPEFLPSQWAFYWSTDPSKAKPFLSIATSPYNKDECCIFEDHIWRSTSEIPNVYSPAEYPNGWTDLGPKSDYIL